MAICLGLDIGSNSIGWALVDDQAGRILGAGVRVFPEGVDRDTQGGELSQHEQRRIARAMRRQIRRRARRKRQLRVVLVGAGLLPDSALLPRCCTPGAPIPAERGWHPPLPISRPESETLSAKNASSSSVRSRAPFRVFAFPTTVKPWPRPATNSSSGML